MIWRKKLRKPKENQCFGAKSLENLRKTNDLAQKASKIKGKPMFWRKKLGKPKEKQGFGYKNLENQRKTHVVAPKA